jgi:predicted rRNA methylase YqxC with S4 and FtsJ domains
MVTQLPYAYGVMRLAKILVSEKLARSGSEANRLIAQGAVSVGGCAPDCDFFATGKCSCGGWKKVTSPIEEIESGLAVKVGTGLWRIVNKIDGTGWDQVNGIGRAP